MRSPFALLSSAAKSVGRRLQGRGKGKAPLVGQAVSQDVFGGLSPGYYFGPGGGGWSEALDWLGPYTPRRVPFSLLKVMREDPQLSLALEAFKSPFFGLDYHLQGGTPTSRAFLERTFRDTPLFNKILESLLNAIDYGFQTHELVWDVRDVVADPDEEGPAQPERHPLAYVLHDVFDLDPQAVSQITVDRFGRMTGVNVNSLTGRWVPEEKLLHAVHQMEHRNWWGRSTLKRGYNPFYWSNWLYVYFMRYMEGRAEPPLIGTAPNDYRDRTDPETGAKTREYLPDVLNGIMTSLRNGSAGTLPFEVDKDTKLPKWKIEVLQDSGRTDTFLSAIEHMNALKMRSLLVPERVATQDGSVGSYASSQVHLDLFFSNMERVKKSLVIASLNHINGLVIRANFGRAAVVPVWESGNLSRDSKEFLGQVVLKCLDVDRITADGRAYKGSEVVDLEKALASLNVPRRKGDVVAQGARAPLPPAPPAPGGTPGAGPSPPKAPIDVKTQASFSLAGGEAPEPTRDSCGIFLPLPPELGAQFPAKAEDSSRPHATILYVGELSRDRFFELVGVARGVAASFTAFDVDLSDYLEFTSYSGKTIAAMIPRARDLEILHDALRTACARAGFSLEHAGPFKPHVTLAYLEDGETYEGTKPSGHWSAQAIEVWGFDEVSIPLTGATSFAAAAEEALLADRSASVERDDRLASALEGIARATREAKPAQVDVYVDAPISAPISAPVTVSPTLEVDLRATLEAPPTTVNVTVPPPTAAKPAPMPEVEVERDSMGRISGLRPKES